MIQAVETKPSEFSRIIREHVAKTVVGQHEVVERVMIALLTGGHLLLEGVPGIALRKTWLQPRFAFPAPHNRDRTKSPLSDETKCGCNPNCHVVFGNGC